MNGCGSGRRGKFKLSSSIGRLRGSGGGAKEEEVMALTAKKENEKEVEIE